MISTLYNLALPSDPSIRCQHLAGIFYHGRLVALGWNKRKTHKLQIQFGKNPHAIYLHAEIDAIRNFLNKHDVKLLKKCVLCVIRIKNGKLSPSKPCLGCLRALVEFDLKYLHS